MKFKHKFLRIVISLLSFFVVGSISAQMSQLKGSSNSLVKQPGFQKLESCRNALVADVVAIDHPMVFNRLGAQNVNWMMYALRHDIIDVASNKTLDYTIVGDQLFASAKANNTSRGIALRPDLRPRPLVLRVAAGGYLKVNFTNLLHAASNPFDYPDQFLGIQHPTEHSPIDQLGLSASNLHKTYTLDDQVASRTVGFHPQGLELVNSMNDDSSYVGKNSNSMVAPGQTKTYCFYAPKEGAYLVSSDGAVFGGEGTSGNSGVGLFGAVTVQPSSGKNNKNGNLGTRFYRAQVTEEELRLATTGTTPSGQPIINYEAIYPNDCPTGPLCKEGKSGKPILNMVHNNRIIHGDINALIVGPNKDGSFSKDTYPLESLGAKNPALPNRLEPFREFVSIFHDENAATQAFPYFFEHPELKHTLHGVRDAFMINYGSGGVGAEIIANRLKAGPMQDCLDCAYEEFFLSSFAVGDAAMLVDKPTNLRISQCQPEYLPGSTEFNTFCVQPPDQKAMEAYYPHDPANVHHSYIGDFVKFRNLHSGKEQHIFHLHNHQWLFNPNDDNSNYIDAQGIGPGSGYTYEIAYGGSGNRNKTVGDAIFHCHFYPHFAQGMWYMWRNHDVFEGGTPLEVSQTPTGFHKEPFGLMHGKPASKSRALPDGEIISGTPIPAIVPLPGKGMAPMPEPVHITQKVNGLGSKAELVNSFSEKTKNPGYPFWVAGVTEHGSHQSSIGSRPTTPPLDMSSIPGVVDGWDGGLPRHALAGYLAGGDAESKISRFTAEKHLKKAKPIYYPEKGTALEQIAMEFHAKPRPGHTTSAIDMAGSVFASFFATNGAKAVPGAPYNEPCIDDRGELLKTGGNGQFFGGTPGTYIDVDPALLPMGIEFGADKPRVYKGANLQLDVIFNKLGYHYPQQRILTLWQDVGPLLDKVRPPEPLVIRMNTFDCAMYAHTNLVPHFFYGDDYQITTPTDVIGQHIHLPKWDLTSADGGANGWNYEDGTFSPGMVRERIHAINSWNDSNPGNAVSTLSGVLKLEPLVHPYFNAANIPNHQVTNCTNLWQSVSGDAHEFEVHYGMPGKCDWLGARTTLQRWFSDPLINKEGVHRGLGVTFTHDHLGPSTHQQLGLYATMLTEPPGSEWRHNETGEKLYNAAVRMDGGPTSWQAVITAKNGTLIDLDKNGSDDSHREFFLQFGDFQHAYVKDAYFGVTDEGYGWMWDPAQKAKPTPDSFRAAINPSFRKPAQPVFPDIIAFEPYCPGGKGTSPNSLLPGSVYLTATNFNNTQLYDASGRPKRPCAEAISADDVGMMVVNYRNEPIGARVYDPSTKNQTIGIQGDLAFAMHNMNRAWSPLNTTNGFAPYPADLTFNMIPTDPFTPIMRAYSGDRVRVKVQGGSHEHEHNGSINAMAWLQGGSGFGRAPHSGWKNSQNTGLSEQFTFDVSITDYWSDTYLHDRMYTVDSSQDGLWNGVWGILRSKNTRDAGDSLVTLPSNPIPTVLLPGQGIGSDNVCPANARVRSYEVVAVLANRALDNSLGVTIPSARNTQNATPGSSKLNLGGGTLVYNPRATNITMMVDDGMGGKKQEVFGVGPLHDPTAILFVRKGDLDPANKIKPGKPVEPIVLRAAAGECIQVILHNKLPENPEEMPDLDGYTSVSGIIHRDTNDPNGSVTSFNNNLICPSNEIGLHPQLVHYNVQTYDGNNVGVNKRSTIKPGETIVYQWYAGAVELSSNGGLVCDDIANGSNAYEKLSLFAQLSKDFNGLPTRSPLITLSEEPRKVFQRIIFSLSNEDGIRIDPTMEERLFNIVAQQGFFNLYTNALQNKADNRRVNDPSDNIKPETLFRELLATKSDTQTQLIQRNADNESLFDSTKYVDPIKDLTFGKIQEIRKSLANSLISALANETQAERIALKIADKLVMNYFYEPIDYLAKTSPYAWRRDFFNEKFKPELNREKIRLARLDNACRYEPIEFGGTNLTPPDRIKQGQKGAIGALIIEPQDAFWFSWTDDAINRQNPGMNQSNTRKTRATATVFYPTNQIAPPFNSKWRFFRDLVMVHQKGLNFRYGTGLPVPNLAAEKENANQNPMQVAPEDAHDSGHMAINYGSEPMWFRFGLPPDAPFGKEGFGGALNAWQAFSNIGCCDNGGTVVSADKLAAIGQPEPYIPIMKVYTGQEMRIRSLLPTGVGRASTVELHGHSWARDPYLPDPTTSSKCIGGNPMSMYLSGQESISPMAHFDMVFPRAGGPSSPDRKKGVSGDYLWRDHGGFGITNGLWALVRAEPLMFGIFPLAKDSSRASCHL